MYESITKNPRGEGQTQGARGQMLPPTERNPVGK